MEYNSFIVVLRVSFVLFCVLYLCAVMDSVLFLGGDALPREFLRAVPPGLGFPMMPSCTTSSW